MLCHVERAVRSTASRSRYLSWADTCSIGFRSGEYGGRNTSLAPTLRIAARMAGR